VNLGLGLAPLQRHLVMYVAISKIQSNMKSKCSHTLSLRDGRSACDVVKIRPEPHPSCQTSQVGQEGSHLPCPGGRTHRTAYSAWLQETATSTQLGHRVPMQSQAPLLTVTL
jgi:hypothetical protein